MPSARLRTTAPLTVTALAAATLLGLTPDAGAVAKPPPFPPPAGIEVNDDGQPQGEGNKPAPTKPEEPGTDTGSDTATDWEPVKAEQSGIAALVHGAVDPWFDIFKSWFKSAPPPEPLPAINWGTIADTSDTTQANAWALRTLGRGKGDVRLAEAHLPAGPKAPTAVKGLLPEAEPLKAHGKDFGTVQNLTSTTSAANGTVTARSRIGGLTLGLPYITGPEPMPADKAPLRLELRDAEATATGRAGRPPQFSTSAKGGKLLSFGRELARFDGPLAPNRGLRIPADKARPAQLLATLNEQITTDEQGHPSVGPNGGYARDPQATSGYVNTAHLTLLAPEAMDVTIGHAAVIHRGAPQKSAP
ncbi:hypothetical protein ACFQVC_16680 [Streptomyces monticola]|uniref:Secreted protein n=1 Tax=Streptomyces monticola TaxID=2666263 RepID=A0ABW2JJN9_9ACTN